jgi:hypothetical protein
MEGRIEKFRTGLTEYKRIAWNRASSVFMHSDTKLRHHHPDANSPRHPSEGRDPALLSAAERAGPPIFSSFRRKPESISVRSDR